MPKDKQKLAGMEGKGKKFIAGLKGKGGKIQPIIATKPIAVKPAVLPPDAPAVGVPKTAKVTTRRKWCLKNTQVVRPVIEANTSASPRIWWRRCVHAPDLPEMPSPRSRPVLETLGWLAREILLLAPLILGALALTLAVRHVVPGGSLWAIVCLHVVLRAWVIATEWAKLATWARPKLLDVGLGILGGGALLAIWFVYNLVLETLGYPPPDLATEIRVLIPSTFTRVAWGAVLVPLAEEGFFRGRLIDGIAPRGGLLAVVIVSALLFAAAHGTPLLFPAYALFGVVLYLLRASTCTCKDLDKIKENLDRAATSEEIWKYIFAWARETYRDVDLPKTNDDLNQKFVQLKNAPASKWYDLIKEGPVKDKEKPEEGRRTQ